LRLLLRLLRAPQLRRMELWLVEVQPARNDDCAAADARGLAFVAQHAH
jgi:hypothetical protein